MTRETQIQKKYRWQKNATFSLVEVEQLGFLGETFVNNLKKILC